MGSIHWVKPARENPSITKALWGQSRGTMEYLIKADPDVSIVDIVNAEALPALGSVLTDQGKTVSGLILASKTSEWTGTTDAGCKIWKCRCEYAPLRNGDPEGGEITNPLLREPQWNFSSSRQQQSPFKDVKGKKYLNAAGDPFDPPPDSEVVIFHATMRRAEVDCPRVKQGTYTNKVSEDGEFLGCGPGTVRCDDIGGDGPHWEFGEGWSVRYWSVTYQFSFRHKPPWFPTEILNRGPRYKDADDKLHFNHDESGTQSTSPCLLDADGNRLEPEAEPTFIEFEQYETATFANLGIATPT